MMEILVGSIPYLLWVLLPLIPAILIFRIFPNATLTAMGAYLVVFGAISFPVVRTGAEITTNLHHHFWLVEGHIKLFDGKGHEKGHELNEVDELIGKKVTATTNPPPYHVDENRFFGSLVEDSADKLPDISIVIDGYVPIIIDPNDEKMKATRDDLHKKIVIDSIAMDKRGAFLPNADVLNKLDTKSAPEGERPVGK